MSSAPPQPKTPVLEGSGGNLSRVVSPLQLIWFTRTLAAWAACNSDDRIYNRAPAHMQRRWVIQGHEKLQSAGARTHCQVGNKSPRPCGWGSSCTREPNSARDLRDQASPPPPEKLLASPQSPSCAGATPRAGTSPAVLQPSPGRAPAKQARSSRFPVAEDALSDEAAGKRGGCCGPLA